MAEIPDLTPPGFEGLNVGRQDAAEQQSGELGQDQFFDLMIAQLKHQDPLKPLESNEFMAQVAQFSQVDAMRGMRDEVTRLAGSLQSNQALQASTMVGRDVLVPGNVGVLDTGGKVSGAVELPQSTSGLDVEVYTPAGEVVRTLQLGAREAGTVQFAWDGLREDGSYAGPGNYVVRARAQVGDENQEMGTLVATRVESVTLNRNPPGLTLNLRGQGSVSMNDVRELL